MPAGNRLEELPGDESPEEEPGAPSGPVDELAQRLGELLTRLGAQWRDDARHRDRTPDYKREFGHQKIPSYSGDIKARKAYTQDVKSMLDLSVLSRGL